MAKSAVKRVEPIRNIDGNTETRDRAHAPSSPVLIPLLCLPKLLLKLGHRAF